MKKDYKKLYEAERKAHRKTRAKLKWKDREERATYKAFKLRKTGMTWVKIAKKVKAPESTLRLATQKRFTHSGLKNDWLRGRWTPSKARASRRLDANTKAYMDKQVSKIMREKEGKFIEKALKDQHLHSYEEYIRQKY